MRPEALLEAQEWLKRAERDHRIAAANLRGSEVFPDATVFFAEQEALRLSGEIVAFVRYQSSPEGGT
jgi:HEPN domain-containing protein